MDVSKNSGFFPQMVHFFGGGWFSSFPLFSPSKNWGDSLFLETPIWINEDEDVSDFQKFMKMEETPIVSLLDEMGNTQNRIKP